MSFRLARRAAVAAIFAATLAAPVAAHAFTPTPFGPIVEAQNFSKIEERQAIYNTPGYQLLLRTVGARNAAAAAAEQVNDPEREFADHVCRSGEDGCAGDVRLYDWQTNGYGIVQPVFFTARNGATLSGHVWATRSGPAKRPGVVITNGWFRADGHFSGPAAQARAKDG